MKIQILINKIALIEGVATVWIVEFFWIKAVADLFIRRLPKFGSAITPMVLIAIVLISVFIGIWLTFNLIDDIVKGTKYEERWKKTRAYINNNFKL